MPSVALSHQRHPRLPPEIPWSVRQLCYAARALPRGYGRVLPALANMLPCLQEVTVDADPCGSLCLDFRELICLPIFVRGCYPHQLAEDHVLDSLLRPGMTVFDVGANIGYYSAFFSRRVGAHGLVVAVEPMPRAIRLLRKTASLCPPNLVIEEVAVGPEPGQARINEMPRLDVSFVSFGQPAQKSFSVEVKTIDQLSRQHGQPDLLKIDVEGAELLALKGARETISSTQSPITMIEYIPGNAAQFGGYSLGDLLEHFPENRFKTYRIAPPCRLNELGAEDGLSTNDYLVVPLDKLSLVAHLVHRS